MCRSKITECYEFVQKWRHILKNPGKLWQLKWLLPCTQRKEWNEMNTSKEWEVAENLKLSNLDNKTSLVWRATKWRRVCPELNSSVRWNCIWRNELSQLFFEYIQTTASNYAPLQVLISQKLALELLIFFYSHSYTVLL